MNPLLQSLEKAIQEQEEITSAHKADLLRFILEADRQWSITEFKLERTDKVKRTTTVLLEQTIAELEQKRKTVEDHNRELTIEASLERVRTVAMSMQKPDDMLDICRVISDELEAMSIANIRDVQTAVINVEEDSYVNYEYFTQYKQPIVLHLNLQHPRVAEFANAVLTAEDAFYTTSFSGDELEAWEAHRLRTNQLPDPLLATALSLHYYFFSIGSGALGISSYGPLREHDITLFKRFRNVFDLAYRRFLDIEQAIAQAKEANIQTGLERVRSRTLAMQSCEELAETAAVVFNELIQQGIAPNRLYIALIDSDDPNEIMFYITDESGGKDCSLYSADIGRNSVFQKMHEGWEQHHKSMTLVLEGEELQEYFRYVRDELHIPLPTHATLDRRIHHIAYFSRGFLGIASIEDQSKETMSLLERFADVFNLTYTRFSDLKVAEALAEQAELDLVKLKEEKIRTENALAELKAAQAQLIQAEKMASLGELTAGIAHEIQNPLNFVNNFAEVNSELIDELHEELAIGNMQSATDVANTIRENENKILFHGKRADAIVKGMLQHSRSSSGQKEPTDINALADEYLRLAYHGLRAKDKSFNATMKTEYDQSIGLINIVPQDIGRVILNLITNAFYAVNSRPAPQPPAPKSPEGDFQTPHGVFEPIVTITTKRKPPIGGLGAKDEGVEIRISDNGPGIPSHILDKIFQPFFTTKPTGQGTGLGLSLSYDIVKAHGGELNVETKEARPDEPVRPGGPVGRGEGTTFIIRLPLS